MSTTAALRGTQFARKMTHFAADVENVGREGVIQSSLVLTNAVAGFLGGRKIRLSGVGKRGANVGVRFDVKGRKNPTGLVYMTGPAQLVERDTKAHGILGRGVGRAKGRSRAARRAAKQELYDTLFGGQSAGRMRIGDAWRTGPFQHPGTQGKHPFAKGIEAARPLVPKIYDRSVQSSMRRIFSG